MKIDTGYRVLTDGGRGDATVTVNEPGRDSRPLAAQ